jgi:hypothetical protein
MPRLRGPTKPPATNTIKPAGSRRGAPPWKPGESGNPLGRNRGSRQRIGEKFLRDFAAEWERRGSAVLHELEGADLVRAAVALLPKQVEVDVEHRVYGISAKPVTIDQWNTEHGLADDDAGQTEQITH